MANITSVVLEQFNEKVNRTSEYTIKDLKNILSEIYKEVVASTREKLIENAGKQRKQRTKRERDENGEVIKKREPSAYNLFIKEQSAKIKETNPLLNSKTIFKMAIDEWKKQKETNVEVEKDETSVPSNTPNTSIHNDDDKNDVTEQIIEVLQATKTKKARKPKKTSSTEDE
jgi:hypothetical protein